jgi:hypothetical protein
MTVDVNRDKTPGNQYQPESELMKLGDYIHTVLYNVFSLFKFNVLLNSVFELCITRDYVK